ncbi:Flagellar hook-associated protein FliD [Devosia sp. DBB001]|nr:Flagellar hook-associated protein FliD [Devosia sp. DBB001]
MSDINLSKAIRSNLLSLQNTAQLMGRTQERLATGNKVNSALDNPTNFFTASSLNARAGDMGNLLDAMSNGVKTLEAADNGLKSITKTLESMQSTLRQARQDKTFMTSSLEVGSAAGNITFSGGSFGNISRSTALQNTALTATAIGLNAAPAAGTAGTAGTAATAGTASFTFGAGGTLDAAATLDFTVTIDGTAHNLSFNSTEWTAIANDAGNFAAAITTKLGAAGSASAAGNAITITSGTTGASSTASIAVATIGGTVGTSTLTPTLAGLNAAVAGTGGAAGVAGTSGQQAFTWGGNAIDVNKDAKIAFTVTVDGKDQKVEIGRSDVLRAGNGDGKIDNATEFAAILSTKLDGAAATASGNAITVKSTTTGATSTIAVGAATVTGINYNADELVQKINSDSNLQGKVRASNDNGKLRLENLSTQDLNVDGVSSSGTIDGTSTGANQILGNAVRSGLSGQYNELRDQLDKLSDDASFNGINLLRGDNLKITFNETGTSAIDIHTKNNESLNAAFLKIENIDSKDLDSDAGIDKMLDTLKEALNTVRSQASTFGSNLSIVQNRQDFTKSMINTLETGAANLTLADSNEEAANLLALQTRQSLSNSALSMAAQADQSVLQLLR